ncbi:hypothetical protein AAP_00729 [Ascosphaera apis ARSEF 7405]|uniref:Uncharacterized protein n=1 Tax=Ascosphaera apis ARSEF 7405 TaxID=392613 RepID=A0A168CWC9_9EURO|nr:hypothetical protein AAP_00729 [Ascosphaera apis ARSEF 7405]
MPNDPSTAAPSNQPRAAVAAVDAAAGATAANANANTTSKKRAHSDYLHDVECRFQYLTEKVLPSAPYLTVSTVQRPLNDRWLVNNWCVGDGCVFSREEEHLQYMTFLSYQDWDTTLTAVGGWSDSIGNVAREEKRPLKVESSTTSDTSATVPKAKKKMTLSDYKVKKNPATMKDMSSSKETPNDVTPRASKTEIREKARSPIPHSRMHHDSPHAIPKHDLEKKLFDSDTIEPGEIINPKREPGALSPSGDQKRITPTSPRAKHHEPSHLDRPTPDAPRDASRDGPGSISPISKSTPQKRTLPRSPDNRVLPPLLSPTLPSPLIRDYPRAKEIFGFDPILPEQISSPDDPLPASLSSSSSSSLQKEQKRTIGKSDRMETKSNLKPPGLAKSAKGNDITPRHQTPLIREKDKAVIGRDDRSKVLSKTASSDLSRLSKPSQNGRPLRLIVKLKYGRSNVQRVNRILRNGQSHKTSTSDASRASKTVSRADAPSMSSKTLKKKLPQPDNESPRSQTVAGKRPSTTKPTKLSSNQQPPSSSMVSVSQRNNEARKRPAANASEPSRTSRVSNRTSTRDRARTSSPFLDDTSQEWYSQSMKYWELACELRRDGQGCPNGAFRAVLHIESLLALTMNCAIQKEKLKALNDQIGYLNCWKAAIKDWVEYRRQITYPSLQKLSMLLGSLLYNFTHEEFLEAAVDNESKATSDNSKTDEELDSVGDLVIPGSTRTKEPSLIADALSMYRLARQYWHKGSALLSNSVLKEKFPDTWQKLRTSSREHVKELDRPGEYDWGDIVPLSTMSTPFEAVRFFYALLIEWASQQNLDWKGQLDLD